MANPGMGRIEQGPEDRRVVGGDAEVGRGLGPGGEAHERSAASAMAGVGAEAVGIREERPPDLALAGQPADGAEHDEQTAALAEAGAVPGPRRGEHIPPLLVIAEGIARITAQDDPAGPQAARGAVATRA